jgi:cobaltochelatase CobT
MVRERLTGEPPPPTARPLVELFRADVEAKAGADLDRLSDAVEDQKSYGRIVRAILRDLKMTDDSIEEAEADEQDDEDEDSGEPEASESDDDGEGESQSDAASAAEDAESVRQESEDADSQMMEAQDSADADDAEEPPEMGEGEQPARPEIKGEGRPITYKVFTTAHDEIVAAEELCDPEELGRLRAYLDQHRPHLPALLQGGGGHRVPRHSSDHPDRQFRLDARPADHGGGGLRRYPGPHAGALRRED